MSAIAETGPTGWRRALLLLPFALFFFVPLLSMLVFSLRSVTGSGYSGAAWTKLLSDQTLVAAILMSLSLAAATVALMILLLVPTMIWVRLRVPWATRLVEFLCLLPLTIPPLVIVVGMRNVYLWVDYFVGESTLALTFVYVVLVLPFAYRAIDSSLSSIDVKTLSEAARSLGASWTTTITRVVVPNIWDGILSAAFISVTVVIGEYTIASLAGYQNQLQVVIVAIGKADGPTSVAASLAALVFGFILISLLSLLSRSRGGDRAAATTTPAPATEGN